MQACIASCLKLAKVSWKRQPKATRAIHRPGSLFTCTSLHAKEFKVHLGPRLHVHHGTTIVAIVLFSALWRDSRRHYGTMAYCGIIGGCE